ncbi:Uncharacterised protein [uncultured archaeon]|nr:Uncharacterised protein [uncultured archaeon]
MFKGACVILGLAVVMAASGCTSTCKPNVNFTLCYQVQSELGVNRCIETGLKDVDCTVSCPDIKKENYRDICYSNVAKKSSDVETCGKIANKTIIQDCVDAILPK